MKKQTLARILPLFVLSVLFVTPAHASGPSSVCASGFAPSAYNGTYVYDGSANYVKADNGYTIYPVFGILYEMGHADRVGTDGAFAINPNQLVTPVSSTWDTNGRDSVTGGRTVSGDCVAPVVDRFPIIADASNGFASSTGLTISDAVGWVSQNLILLWIGSGFSVLYNLRYWILALLIISTIVTWGYLYLRYRRTGSLYRK